MRSRFSISNSTPPANSLLISGISRFHHDGRNYSLLFLGSHLPLLAFSSFLYFGSRYPFLRHSRLIYIPDSLALDSCRSLSSQFVHLRRARSSLCSFASVPATVVAFAASPFVILARRGDLFALAALRRARAVIEADSPSPSKSDGEAEPSRESFIKFLITEI